MLKSLQIIALLQGLFVLYVLFINRKEYKKTTFWLLFGSLLSVLLYIGGDDDNNLFVQDADLFLFDSSLFVTFLFLFFRYYSNGKPRFARKDLFFFLPNLVYFILEAVEVVFSEELLFTEIFEILVELVFVGYLLYIVYTAITTRKKHWVLYFAIPISFLLGMAMLNDVFMSFGFEEFEIFNDQVFNSYLLVIIAFLFYFISFGLMNKRGGILPKSEDNKYRNSNLNPDLIEL